MRAAWSRHVGLDALNLAAVALLRRAGVQDGVAAAATMPKGHPPRGSRKRAAAGAPAAGAGRGGGRSKRQARRSSPEGSDDDAAAVAPAAAGATTPPEAKTHQTASPGGGHGRVRRGPQASIRGARRTQLATSVRRVLRRTRLSRWTVPRHEAEKVARWLVYPTAAAGNSSSSTTPDAPLQDRVDALPRRKGCRRLAPVTGLRYGLSAAHFREASGGNFLAHAVVVAMGTERVRGGDAWLRRHLRRLCWFVDQDEFNTSQACSECHDKVVLIYSTGNSPPKIPGELYGPPAGPPPSIRRVRMAAGSRRGRPKRALPSAAHVMRRGPDPDAYRAAVRATARAAAVARRAAALAACAVEGRAVFADPRRLSEWAANGCYTCSLAAP
ncbi:hypothetical protein I4F81_006475 [Pyropia yezoensis]|uniref:Uncharacterized protein n=1 Tax=Pyropia yezoensis TaxID=2788 RepID=A0ACC3C294_PYRYE|nr:hypothetical protein I4F81_006475 [Neopyropia yezoensis]